MVNSYVRRRDSEVLIELILILLISHLCPEIVEYGTQVRYIGEIRYLPFVVQSRPENQSGAERILNQLACPMLCIEVDVLDKQTASLQDIHDDPVDKARAESTL